MKVFDIEPSVILDVYLKEIRSLLELAVPAWHSGLTQRRKSDIERVQQVAVHVILSDCRTGKSEFNYDMALVTLDIEPLQVRRNCASALLRKRSSPVIRIYSWTIRANISTEKNLSL